MSNPIFLILGILKHMGVYEGAPNPPCAQSRMARTAREHESLMARHMMSNHSCSARPLPTCKASIVVTATMFTIFKPIYEGGAAIGRATSFAVSSVVVMNRVDVVALNAIFALRLSKTRRTVGRTDSRLDGWSVQTDDWSGKSDSSRLFPFHNSV